MAGLTAGPVFAQETGSISGVIRAEDGSAMPGVTVRVTSDLLPAGRSEVTDADGVYNFQRLPPGTYQVVAELTGLGTVQREAVVSLGKDTQLDLVLNASMAEEITVAAVVPVIDLKSSEVQVNYTQEVIEDLPITRTYKGLFQLAPGVSENNRLAPNAGGARMDNTFLLDGVNITNPHYGDIVPDVAEIDIDEVSIKRGGITAEFGRTGGMVVNAVTKSGTNQFHGQGRYELQPASFVSDSKGPIQNTIDRDGPALALGGPILQDRFWFYGSANFPTSTTTDRRNNLGAVPDRELQTDEYFVKLTANPSSSHYLSAAGRSRESTTSNAGILASSHPSVGSDDSTDYLIGTATWTWNLNADSFLETKYNHDKEENSTDPTTNLGYQPAFDALHPERNGLFTTTPDFLVGGATGVGQSVGGASLAVNNQDFTRDDWRLTYQLFRGWFGTTHDIRAGISFEESSERLERRANGWGIVTWNPTTRLFTASYTSQQPPHTGRGEAYGVFLQDQFTLGDRATVTAGLLVNKDVYYGEGLGTPGTKTKRKILTFDFDQQIQPRLGVTFVPSREIGDKLYAYLGRYYNTENKSLVRAASPTRIFTTRATFDAAGNKTSDIPAANTQTKTVASGIDPQYTDEYILGYSRPLAPAWAVDLVGQYREVGDMMEDISADGLGNGPFRVDQLPGAYRKYTAATLQLVRVPRNDSLYRLTLNASYTWSRLEGNWDIDYAESLFYNSSFLQDGPGVLITDNRDGLLRGDRTHVAKILATVRPWDPVRFGTYVRYQSGGAWEARGLPDASVSSSSYVRYLERAGSRRMEDWLNVDLLGSYEFLFGRVGLELEGRVVNVFDEQVELAVDDRLILGRATVPNNPAFGTATEVSSPRAFVASAILRF
ncbi:MAG TPA: carboxypeptidase regulatory-like domain-containing protein [Thermoanaerobaculia bacterium]|nr:carboxypeptidase regulatory-like domain-containing protein [Thermoanaerobaculia bacterium]